MLSGGLLATALSLLDEVNDLADGLAVVGGGYLNLVQASFLLIQLQAELDKKHHDHAD